MIAGLLNWSQPCKAAVHDYVDSIGRLLDVWGGGAQLKRGEGSNRRGG